MRIELNIFTNCTKSAPNTQTILKTYNSFCNTFGKIPTTIWCDPNPNKNEYNRYINNLKKYFPIIKKSLSLSDGYIKSILSSKSEYMFMLEHDWIFNKTYIKHFLPELIKMMKENGIYHLRFNKRKNIVAGWDRWLKEFQPNNFDMKCCKTPIMSNNPHIINRIKYLEFLKKGYIKTFSGSKGIEEQLKKINGINGVIYGELNHNATIYHIDGRKNG